MIATRKSLRGSTKFRYGLLSAAAILATTQLGAHSASAAINYTWTGAAADSQWHLAGSSDWSGGTGLWVNSAAPSADTATFNLATPASISVTSAILVNRILFTTSGWTLSGGAGGSLSNQAVTVAASVTINTGIFATNTDTVSAPIIENPSNAGGFHTSFSSFGWGTLTISGVNTFLGGLMVQDGTLRLDGSTGSFNSATTVGLHGTTFVYDNTNSSGVMAQSLGTLSEGPATVGEGGEGTVINIQGNTATSSTLTFASIGSPATGSTYNFIVSGTTNGTTVAIKDSGALPTGNTTVFFFDGADYAFLAGGAGGFLRAPAYGTDANYIAADSIGSSLANNSANNYLVTTQSIASQSTAAAKTIKFSGAGVVNMTLASGATLTLGASGIPGGLLVAGGTSTTITGTGGAAISNAAGTGTDSYSFRTDTIYDNLTIDLPLLVGGGNALVKSGSGTLFMTANAMNTYGASGVIGTYVDGGILSIVQNSNLGSQTLGDAVTINGGTLQANANVGLYNGLTPGTNNRGVSIGQNATIDVTGSNTLTIAGVVKDSSGDPGRLIKTNTGTLLLTAAETYSGGTTINNGTLKLDANTGTLIAGQNGSGFIAITAFALGGGTFDYDNTNSSASAKSMTLGIGSGSILTFAAGDSTVENVQGPTATSSLLTFPSVNARTPGATGNFVFSNRTALSTTNGIVLTGVAAGFINQGEFFGGANYAVMNATGTFVRAPVYGTDTGVGFAFVAADTLGTSLASSATSNYLVTTASITSQTTASAKTIKFGGGTTVNMTLAGGAALTLASGGILVSGNTTTTITGSGGANITAASGVEYVFRTDVAADNLTIDLPLLATGVNVFTKSGAGTLTMTANAVNTYTGGTFIDGGVLNVSQNSNLGDQGTGAAVTINNGTLQAAATFGLYFGSPGTNNRAVNLENDATFDVSGSNTLTIAGVVASVPTYPGHLIKTDTGTLALSGANTYGGGILVNAGTLQFAKEAALYNNTPAGWTAANITVANNATLALNVGGTGEFTASDVQTIAGIGTATTGFVSGATLALDTTNAGGNFTYGNSLNNPNGGSNALGLSKIGSGTLTLNTTNNYTGGTLITAGKLAIVSTGSINTTSGVSINGSTANFNFNGSAAYTQPLSFGASGGTLSGAGTISSSGGVSAGTNAIVAPGNSPGILTFTTGLTVASSGTYLWANNGGNSNSQVAGTDFSQIAVSAGTVTINSGANLSLSFNATTNFSNAFWTSTETFDLIHKSGTGAVSGTFANGNITISGTNASLSNFANNSLTQGTFSTAITGGDLILTWTPAPTTTATTYTLSAGAGSLNVLLNGTTSASASITNSGTVTADTLNFTGLVSASGAGGIITGTAFSGGPLNQTVSSSNTSLTFQGTAYGSATLTPSVTTATNATIPGNATNNGTTTASVNVGEANADNSNSQSSFTGTVLTGTVAASGSYAGLASRVFTATAGTGGAGTLNSEATLLAGTSTNGNTVSMTWRTRITGEVFPNATDPSIPYTAPHGLVSDVVRLTGMNLAGGQTRGATVQTDDFVLQMTYSGISGGSEAVEAANGGIYLAYLDPADTQWTNAVQGNFTVDGNTGRYALTDFLGSYSAFVADENTAHPGWTLNDVLGSWGVDTAAATDSTGAPIDGDVWAVLNHNSDFAVLVPEPASLTLLGLGAVGLLARRRRR